MLELKNIYKDYTNTKVLKNINLSIKKGEFVAIIGQSGSGKSTLMNILACLDTPSKGSYKIENEEVLELNSEQLAELRQKKFGFIFQSYNLLSNLTALENVMLPSVYTGLKKAKREELAKDLLSKLDLDNRYKNLPNELSGGQQQRVSIARSLINGGEVILADEPTGALDSNSGLAVMEIIKKLNEQGHTIILVTHDLNIANWANRIIQIKDGEILSDTSKDEVKVKNLEIKKEKKSFWYIKDQLVESLKMAIHSISTHKLRSILTMLGIIIGIASVISVVALGKGSSKKILSSISEIGTNTITILPGRGFGDLESGVFKPLELSDVNILKNQDFVDSITPTVAETGVINYKNISLNAEIEGGSEDTFLVNGVKLLSGRLLNSNDIKDSNSVVVIDKNTKNSLFKYGENPLGKMIIFDNKALKIIGVAKDNPMYNQGKQLKLWLPYSTVINKITGSQIIESIVVKIKDSYNIQKAQSKIIDILKYKHKSKDFFTLNSDTLKKTVEKTTATMTLLISAIAIISLIVGGIGVMNTMLVSVTQRTKEIGIRMAIGAKSFNILSQFLIEAILICLIGGILGVLLSFAIAYVFNEINQDFKMIFSLNSIILAIVSSSFIGIVFGFIPARNASKLNPIEALNRD